jgi:hypothetical protein
MLINPFFPKSLRINPQILPQKNFPEKFCTRKSPSKMSSTPITPSTLATSYFGSNGPIPTVRGTSTASWPSVSANGAAKPFVRRPSPPALNKIYFNKKQFVKAQNRYDVNSDSTIIESYWEIPFSVDVEVPVGDLIQRIQNVMKKRTEFNHWDINMNTFLITAVTRTTQKPTL